MRYTVVLEQESDGGYVVSVPALPGCVSQGDGRAEAVANIRGAVELYTEDCREAGDRIPTEAGRECGVTILMPEWLCPTTSR
jgi:predicted RNase H-like HicB family nuclease